MKQTLIAFLMIVSCHVAFGQSRFFNTFTDATVFTSFHQGLGAEIGHWGNPDGVKQEKYGGFLGFNMDFKKKDLSLYFKGQYHFNKYVAVTALAGLTDFNRLHTGVGLRGVYAVDQGIYLMLEPTWKNTGSTVNFGVSLDL